MALHGKIDSAGRIVLPAELRRHLGLSTGDVVAFTLEDGSIRLRSQRAALAELRQRLHGVVPEGRSVVDDFIADRRAEAEREVRAPRCVGAPGIGPR